MSTTVATKRVPKPGNMVVPKKELPLSIKVRKLLDECKHRKPKTNIINKLKKLTPTMGILGHHAVDVETAKDMLTLNTGNRPVTLPDIERYLYQMKNGKWIYNGDSIRFDKKLNMINGQNSLIALVLSGTKQYFNIQAGLPENAFGTIDAGKKRTGGDVLAIAGYDDYNMLAAAVKAYIYYQNEGKIGTYIHSKRVNNQMILEWVEKNNVKLMVKCIEYAKSDLVKKGQFLSTSTWGFIYYLLSEKHRSDATTFVTLLASGAGISPQRHNAIYLLREKLLKFPSLHIKQLQAGGSKTVDLKARYVIRAWNAWRKGEKLGTDLKVDQKNPIEKPV